MIKFFFSLDPDPRPTLRKDRIRPSLDINSKNYGGKISSIFYLLNYITLNNEIIWIFSKTCAIFPMNK